MILKIKNWSIYQHYKDRNPPWIKLHFSLLSSKDWVMLDNDARVLAIASMLIASHNEVPGEFEADPDYFQRVAYLKKKPDWKPLIDIGFLEGASDCLQMLAEARPEERRGETEKEERQRAQAPFVIPGFIKPDDWSAFEEMRKKIRKPMTDRARQNIVAKLKKMEESGVDVSEVLNRSINNSWQDVFEPHGKHVNGSPRTDQDWMNKGLQMGIQAKPGESMPAYITRIKSAMENHHGS